MRERFAGALIVRLSGLVGPGLRKNALHDLCHGHETGKLDPEAVYQFYPMVNLWSDIARAAGSGLTLVHFCGAPLRLGEVAREVFGRELTAPRPAGAPVPAYDVRSRHAGRMGGNGAYLYGPRESLLAVRAYAQSEPRAA